MKLFVKTFGCKVNQFESEYFINKLLEKKINLTSSEKESDIIIVNSCAVTSEAVRQLKQYLRKLRRECKNSYIILTGCFVDANEKCDESLYDKKISNYFKKDLPEIIFNKKEKIFYNNIFKQDKFIILNSNETFQHTRKFLKIQDGCSNYCSYCIIPYVRGKPRSLPLEKLIENILLLSQNFKEVVLTGINIELYGKDLKIKDGFLEMVNLVENELLKKNVKDFRIRITSLKPDKILFKYIDFVNSSKYFTPHFHISIQNMNNKVLKLMNRNYNSEDIFNIVSKIREVLPYAGVGADIITGFIGEGTLEFEDNLKKLEEIDINFFHIFPFSKRDKTKSACLNEVLSRKEKKERVKILKKITDRKKEDFIKRNLNKTLKVLVEKEEDNFFSGYSENYIKIFIPKKNYFTLKNKFVNVYVKNIKNRFFLEGDV